MFSTKRKLNFERLENRLMMAGDIAASLQNGNLYLTEARGQAGRDNGALVSQLDNGQIRIQGTSVSGPASLVNGAAFQDFSVPGSLFVNFGAGNDRVEFSGIGPTIKFQSVDLNMGPSTGDSLVFDNDTVSLQNFQTTAGLSIYTGKGDDNVNIFGGIVGNYKSNDQLWVKTGSGADYVSIQNTGIHGQLFVQTFDALGENDVDTLYVDKETDVAGNATLLTGGGADQVLLGLKSTQGYDHSLNVTGSLNLDSGDGADQVSIYNAFIGWSVGNTTVIQTGAGADKVDIDGPNTWLTSLNLQTYSQLSEADVDVVSLHSITLGGDAFVRTGGGNDQFSTSSSDAPSLSSGLICTGSLTIDTGAGDDLISMSAVAVAMHPTDTLVIHSGAGADTINLVNTYFLGGNNSLNNLVVQSYDSLTENDVDRVTLNSVYVVNNLTISLGGGDDHFTLKGNTHANNISVDAGDGKDTGTVQSILATNAIVLEMGKGDDFLSLDDVRAHQLNFDGGDGIDTYSRSNAMAVDMLMGSGWEYFEYYNPLGIYPVGDRISNPNGGVFKTTGK